jgi:Ca-activated chloride channel family protein
MTLPTFAHPYFLLLLLLLPLLAWLKGRRGQQSAFLYSSVQLVRPVANISQWSPGRILLALRWLALAAFIFGLARPQLTKSETSIRASGVDIVVALDLSGSMAAEDDGFKLRGQQMNRVGIAKDVIQKFIAKRPNDRIGIVAFAREAYIAAPLTLDHDFLLQNLERLNLDSIDNTATAIGSALSASVNRLRELQSKSKIVILMTDGQSNAGKVPPLTAAEAAQTLGVKVYTIGVGTRGTARIPGTDVFGRKIYQTIQADIDEETLQAIAKKTGGKYYRADNTDTLHKVYDEIDKLETTEVETKKFVQIEELLGWVVWPGLGLLLLEILLGNTVWRKLP